MFSYPYLGRWSNLTNIFQRIEKNVGRARCEHEWVSIMFYNHVTSSSNKHRLVLPKEFKPRKKQPQKNTTSHCGCRFWMLAIEEFRDLHRGIGESKCLEPWKAEPQEMFGGSNTDPHKVFECLVLQHHDLFQKKNPLVKSERGNLQKQQAKSWSRWKGLKTYGRVANDAGIIKRAWKSCW